MLKKNHNCSRILFSKHTQPSTDEPEVVTAAHEPLNAWQKYINEIVTILVKVYTKFHQKINHRSGDNVRKVS